MSDITETTELGDGYDQPNEAVEESVDHAEYDVTHYEGGPADYDTGGHWSDLKFIYLAIGLAVVTAIEVAMSYTIDFWGPLFLPGLLVLMAVKFFAVVTYFMHLKFDNRLFSVMFYMGLFLAVGVYIAALFTFRFFSR